MDEFDDIIIDGAGVYITASDEVAEQIAANVEVVNKMINVAVMVFLDNMFEEIEHKHGTAKFDIRSLDDIVANIITNVPLGIHLKAKSSLH